MISFNEEKDALIKKLSDSFQLLVGLDALRKAAQRDRINAFMASIGRLFIRYFQYDLELAQQVGRANQKLLQDNKWGFFDYVNGTEGTLVMILYQEQWGSACVGRTRIEAFNAMFKGIVEPLDTEDLEELMRNTSAKYIGVDPDEIPENIPDSHWWWLA